MTTPHSHSGPLSGLPASAGPGRPAEPLPPDFGANLREIDSLLARHAARASVPRDLADAVYDATLGLLWKREEPIRTATRSTRDTVWSRLAMAAAVAMAFTVAAMFIRVPLEARDSVASSGLLPTEVERILLESPLGAAQGDADYLEHLIDFNDMSYEEISGDLDRLVEELEL